MLIRNAERFRSEHGDIVSLHCFAAGAHYDPSRLGVGALIACDEHLIGPGGGFDEHAHRGVQIVSWVLAGTLHHVGGQGELLVRPGRLLVQSCGDGIRHSERNASRTEPLRLLQLTLVGGPDVPGVRLEPPPAELEAGLVSVVRTSQRRVVSPGLVHVLAGSATVGDVHLGAGDSLSVGQDAPMHVSGEALVVELRAAPVPA